MGIQGPYRVEADELLPFGHAVVGGVGPSRDWDRSTRERAVQEVDADSGLPVWVADVMDFDPEARERTFRVKIIAAVQPVPPGAVDGLPVRPVHLDGLTVRPYVKEAGKDRRTGQPKFIVGFSLWATGLSEPRYGAQRSSGSSAAATSSSSSSPGSGSSGSGSSGSGSKAAA